MSSEQSRRSGETPRGEGEPLATGQIELRTLGGEPSLDSYVYVPRERPAQPPIVVAVHGTSLNAREHAAAFAPLAERRGCILLAPHFAPPTFEDYQRLGRVHLAQRADLALNRLVEAVGRLAGTETGKLHLFGHSGGGQFVSRYAMVHPQRVAAAVVVAAGWYTFPERQRTYPYGIRPSPRLPGVRFDLERLLCVPTLVLVGSEQSQRVGALRRSRRLDLQQGKTRLERASRFIAAMRTAAAHHELRPVHQLRELPEASGRFGPGERRTKLAELAMEFFFDRDDENAGSRSEPLLKAV